MKKKIKKFSILVIIIVIIAISGAGIGITYAAIAASTVSYTSNGQSTVQGALDDLYTKAAKCLQSVFKLGDYFSLTPDVTSYTVKKEYTGYTSDQIISIAGSSASDGLRLWRVIDIHSDGSVDAVSEYVSEDRVYFKGTTGYQYCVSTLQAIAAQYAKSGYTIATRMMGYGGQTPVIADISAFDGSTNTSPSTTTIASPTTGTGQEYSGGVLGDSLYLKDYLLVGNVYKTDTSTYGSTGLKTYKVGTTTATNYWLASRRFSYGSSTDFIFYGRKIDTNGNLDSGYMRQFYGSYWNVGVSQSGSVRPIITLKSGVTIASGSGTKTSPYVLN